jgi:hypothetical protein
VVVDALAGVGRVVELVVDRATRVVGPDPARPDGLPPHDATTRPTTAHSTAARPARVDPPFGPAVVVSPPGAA